MQEGGAASQISQNKERFFDHLGLMPGEENVIQKEEQPVEKLSNGPDQIEKRKEYDALASETGRGVFGVEKGAVGGSPKKAEIGIHSVRDP